jgi:predicted RNA binding protein YcfA (HicA-like mRNA interferase family)
LPKLGRFSGREVCRILETHGFEFIRQKGSHRVMQRRNQATTITVIVPDHPEIRIGTLSSIIRQSKLDRSFF